MNPWSEDIRNRWFYGALAISTIAVIVLFWPFLYTLMFAVVTVVVTWPVHRWVTSKVPNRPAVAAVLTALLLFFVVFGPVGTVLYLFALEAAQVWGQVQDFIESGELQTWIEWLRNDELAVVQLWMDEWLGDWLPEGTDLIGAAIDRLQSLAVTSINAGAQSVVGIVSATATSALQALIFVFAVISLYMEGPRVLRAIKNLSPMDDGYEDRLFDVFREFANNMVLGSIVSGALQGVVAGIGYGIAGADRVVFLGLLTGVFSFIPLVGTAVVWVPVAIGVFVTKGLGWAIFIALWSMLFTASVDNVVKPLMLRGNTNIHPLLIFLAVFGGMSWMGVPGVLVGPVIVAFFLALYHLYVRDHLGVEMPEPDASGPALPAWLTRFFPALGARDGSTVETAALPADDESVG
ncbi:MAG: AI-2E family transporter [Deltaproteobacteria bacterium]|nr:MAG: AI-2E family transporter [Deltaproteobacteria bacterium]